jgi:hypothetical protein
MKIVKFERSPREMHLPDDLLGEKRWLVWRQEDGRKVPYYPAVHRRRSGTMETAQDMAAMATHAEAMEALRSHTPHYTGLGYAITHGNLLIDLDDVLDSSGAFCDEWAERFTYKAVAAGAFVEVSHSGTGIHVIGRGHARKAGSKGVHIEVYPDKRFVAITGQCLPRTTCPDSVADVSDLAEEALQEHQRRCDEKGLNSLSSALVSEDDLAFLRGQVEGDTLTQVRTLLQVFSPDERDQWYKVGLALGRAFPKQQEVFEEYVKWSRASPNYAGARDDKTMADLFFRQALLPTKSKYTLDTMIAQAATVGVQLKLFAAAFDDLPPEELTEKKEPSPEKSRRAGMLGWERNAHDARDLFANPPPPMEFIIEDILPKHRTTFAAPGGTGKTQLTLWMALHVAAGRKMFGRYEVKRPGRVLVMNAEDPKKQLQRRLIQLANHIEWLSEEEKYAAFERVAFVDFELETFALTAQLQRTNHYDITGVVGEIVDAYKTADLSWVIFDPMTLFGFDEAGGNDSASAMMKAAGILADRLNCAVTYVTHTTKAGARAGEADMHTTRGAAAFGDLTRAHWNLINYRPYDPINKTRFLQLSFDKASYAAPQQPVHLQAVENNRFFVYDPEDEEGNDFDERLWEGVKEAIAFLRKSGAACSVDTVSTYGYEIDGQTIGRLRVKPKLREWIQGGRLELTSEGRRKGQLVVSAAYEENNF